MKTDRHELFVTIPGLRSDSPLDVSKYSALIDHAVDELDRLCRGDKALLFALEQTSDRQAAYSQIARYLKCATTEHPWLRAHAGADLCRRVLYLLHPNRFGFETYGWIH